MEKADADAQCGFIGELLQFQFPQPHTEAIASAAVSGNRQAGGLRVCLLPIDRHQRRMLSTANPPVLTIFFGDDVVLPKVIAAGNPAYPSYCAACSFADDGKSAMIIPYAVFYE